MPRHSARARTRSRAAIALIAGALLCVAPNAHAAAGPVAAYSFDGGGITANDDSGHGNTAALSSTTWTAAGHYGAAVSFDGSKSMISVPDATALDMKSSFTLEAWVRPTVSTRGPRTLIAKERDGGGFPYGLELSDGVPAGYLTTGTRDTTVSAKSPLSLGRWYFLAVTYDGARARLFVDGSQVGSKAVSGQLATSRDPLRLGGDAVWGEHFSGLLDNIRVYGRALSATELRTDRRTAVPPLPAAPLPPSSPPPPSAPPPTDQQAPSTPSGLASSATETSLTLSWAPSHDDTGVAGYHTFADGAPAGDTTATSQTFAGRACGTSHTLEVSAFDAAGNTSARALLSTQTSPCPSTSPPQPSDRSAANLWIDPTGGACARQATPGPWSDGQACGSFRAALQAARAGDLVLVRCVGGTSCSFPSETLSGDRGTSAPVTFASASGYSISFAQATGSGQYVWLDGLRDVTFEDIGFGRNNSADSSPNLRVDCSRNVTLVNASGRRFYMFEGNANVTFRGGDWGGYSSPGEEDSTMGTTGASGPQRTCAGDAGPRPQSDITFDGVRFHDVFWSATCTFVNGGQCSEWGGAHPDCFEINGYVDGVTIENSIFERCGNTMLSLYTDQGDIRNVIAQNNVFREMAASTYYGIQWVDTTAGFSCSGNKFLNNTYTPSAPGAWTPYAPPRFECAAPSSSAGTEVSGNTFEGGPPATQCSTSKQSPNWTIWSANTFQQGNAC